MHGWGKWGGNKIEEHFWCWSSPGFFSSLKFIRLKTKTTHLPLSGYYYVSTTSLFQGNLAQANNLIVHYRNFPKDSLTFNRKHQQLVYGLKFPVFKIFALLFLSVLNHERLNKQMNNGQTTYKKKTLTHNLQQPTQKTNLLSRVTSPGSPPAIYRSDL